MPDKCSDSLRLCELCRVAMAVTFSSSGDNVMTRQIAAYLCSSFTDVSEEFDIASTAKWICEKIFRRVCMTHLCG